MSEGWEIITNTKIFASLAIFTARVAQTSSNYILFEWSIRYFKYLIYCFYFTKAFEIKLFLDYWRSQGLVFRFEILF